MNIKVMDATNAYANVLKNQGGGIGVDKIGSIAGLAGSGGDSSSSFSDVLKAAMTETSSAIGASSNVSIAALNGKADLVDVVTAVQNAEIVLDTVAAVRDKVISAYQDIIKMPI